MPSGLNQAALEKIKTQFPSLSVLVLIGSRATGKTHANSDWDFAFFFSEPDDFLQLALTEQLREALGSLLACNSGMVDLVDIRSANLAISASIADEGMPLITTDARFWFKFLERTWRDLEYWHWEQAHAT